MCACVCMCGWKCAGFGGGFCVQDDSMKKKKRMCLNKPLFENACVQAWMCTFFLVRSALLCVRTGFHNVWHRRRPLKSSSHSVTALPPKPPSYMLSHWIDNAADVPGAKFTLNIINGRLWNRGGSTCTRRSSKNIHKAPNAGTINQKGSHVTVVVNVSTW